MNLSSTSASLAIKFNLVARSSRISLFTSSSRIFSLSESASSCEGAGPSALTRVRKYFSTSSRWISLPLTTAQTSGPGAASFLQPAAQTHATTAARITIDRGKRDSFRGEAAFKRPFSRGRNECRRCTRERACARL